MNYDSYCNVAVNKCISDFENMFTNNKFISKKEFDYFLDKYNDIFAFYKYNEDLLDSVNKDKLK